MPGLRDGCLVGLLCVGGVMFAAVAGWVGGGGTDSLF